MKILLCLVLWCGCADAPSNLDPSISQTSSTEPASPAADEVAQEEVAPTEEADPSSTAESPDQPTPEAAAPERPLHRWCRGIHTGFGTFQTGERKTVKDRLHHLASVILWTERCLGDASLVEEARAAHRDPDGYLALPPAPAQAPADPAIANLPIFETHPRLEELARRLADALMARDPRLLRAAQYTWILYHWDGTGGFSCLPWRIRSILIDMVGNPRLTSDVHSGGVVLSGFTLPYLRRTFRGRCRRGRSQRRSR